MIVNSLKAPLSLPLPLLYKLVTQKTAKYPHLDTTTKIGLVGDSKHWLTWFFWTFVEPKLGVSVDSTAIKFTLPIPSLKNQGCKTIPTVNRFGLQNSQCKNKKQVQLYHHAEPWPISSIRCHPKKYTLKNSLKLALTQQPS